MARPFGDDDRPPAPKATAWWHGAVIYQVYPRSFQDSNGDGIGDLPGISRRLEYLAELGVDALWLNPIHPSPDKDFGYDVADYCAIHPHFGSLADFDVLIAEAGRLNVRVLLDLVPNHTSDQHSWFKQERLRPPSPEDRYVWAPGRDGGPPNNWISAFGGPAWSHDDQRGLWYLHHYLPSQPDLDWWKAHVQNDFLDILDFWFARGVAGFRIDVVQHIVKDRQLRDNPPATSEDHELFQRLGQRQLYNATRPESHEILRSWRRAADAQDPPKLLLGEVYVFDPGTLAGYYGDEDELHLTFNFSLSHADFEAAQLEQVLTSGAEFHDQVGPSAWAASNHDIGRFASRWCAGDKGKIAVALLLLLSLPGTPVLYYGDELGLDEVDISPADRRDSGVDPQGRGSRDRSRTPMRWSPDSQGGFTVDGATSWLPVGNALGQDVQSQLGDPNSTLELTRRLLALRRRTEQLRTGRLSEVNREGTVLSWRRGETVSVFCNLGDAPSTVEASPLGVLDAVGAYEVAEEGLKLEGWAGVIVEGFAISNLLR